MTKPVQGLAAISMRIGTPEVRIGELMREVPRAKNGGANQYQAKCPSVGNERSKADVIADMGFTHSQVQRFETLAAHPEAVERAKAEGFASAILPTAGQNYKKDGY